MGCVSRGGYWNLVRRLQDVATLLSLELAMRSSATKEAYELLGIMEAAAQKQPQITSHLKQLAKAVDAMNPAEGAPKFSPIYFLRCSDAPEARKFLDVYDSLPNVVRKAVPIEAFCAAASISPLRLLEIIAGTAWRLSASTSTIMHAMAQPKVVKKSIDVALTDEGIADRTILHKAAGFLPMPRNQTTVNVNQNNNTAQVVAPTPPPEKTIRTMVDRFNEGRLLTPASDIPVVAFTHDAEYDEDETEG